MAKGSKATLFLDTNVLIDLIDQRNNYDISIFVGHPLVLSVASVLTMAYVLKVTVPNKMIFSKIELFRIEPVTEELHAMSLHGPTSDYEDNIQLHSAEKSGAEYFITSDKELLDLEKYGLLEIVHPQEFEKIIKQ